MHPALLLCAALGALLGIFAAAVRADDRPPEPAGETYVLAIGVDAYDDPRIPALRFAEADARAVAGFYAGAAWSPAGPSRTALLLGKDATRGRILRAVRESLAQRATRPEDTAILYFAGHGFADAQTTYLAGRDAEIAGLPETAITVDQLAEAWRAVRAGRRLIILDACHAGGVEGVRGIGGVSQAPIAAAAVAGGRTVVLAAAGASELSAEDAQAGRGVFTLGLLRGLEGAADASGDGAVTDAELTTFLAREVPALAAKVGGRQTPEAKVEGAGPSVVVAATPAARARTAPDASEEAPRSDVPAGAVRLLDLEPRDGTRVRDEGVLVRGRVEGKGVDAVLLGGVPLTPGGGGRFELRVAATAEIPVEAVDAEGRVLARAVLRLVIDRRAPAIVLAGERPGDAAAGQAITAVRPDVEAVIEGTVQDDDALVRLEVDGVAVALEGGRFRIARAPRASGDVEVALAALDRAGNATRREVIVRIDAAPPSLEVTEPLEGARVTDAVLVCGTARDDIRVAEVLVAGRPAALVREGSAWKFKLSVPAPATDTVLAIEVVALDAAGNASAPALRIVRGARLDVDGEILPEGALRRLGSRRGSLRDVIASAPSGDGALVWVLCGDGRLASVDPATGRIRDLPPVQNGASLAASADGRRLVVAHRYREDGVVIDVATEKRTPLVPAKTDQSFFRDHRIAISANGELVARAGEDGCQIFDGASGKLLRVVPAEGPRSVSLSPDGKRLAIVLGNASRVVSTATGEAVAALPNESGNLICASFLGDGRLALIRAYSPLTIEILDASTLALDATVPFAPASRVRSSSINEAKIVGGGRALVTWSTFKTMTALRGLVDLRTGAVEELPTIGQDPRSLALAAGRLAHVDADGVLGFIEPGALGLSRPWTGHAGPVRALRLYEGGAALASADARSVRRWRVESGREVQALAPPDAVAAAVGPDGLAAFLLDRGALEVWRPDGVSATSVKLKGEASSGELAVGGGPALLVSRLSEIRTFRDAMDDGGRLVNPKGQGWLLAISDDGRYAAWSRYDEGYSLALTTGIRSLETSRLRGPGQPRAASFSQSSLLFAAGFRDGAIVAPCENFYRGVTTPVDDLTALAFSADERTLLVAGKRKIGERTATGVLLLDVDPTKEWPKTLPARAFLETGEPATALAVSPDGATIATGHADGTILLWPAPKEAR